MSKFNSYPVGQVMTFIYHTNWTDTVADIGERFKAISEREGWRNGKTHEYLSSRRNASLCKVFVESTARQPEKCHVEFAVGETTPDWSSRKIKKALLDLVGNYESFLKSNIRLMKRKEHGTYKIKAALMILLKIAAAAATREKKDKLSLSPTEIEKAVNKVLKRRKPNSEIYVKNLILLLKNRKRSPKKTKLVRRKVLERILKGTFPTNKKQGKDKQKKVVKKKDDDEMPTDSDEN